MSRTAWQRKAPDHEITEDDVQVVVEDTLLDNQGNVVDLTSATIRYEARLPGSAALDIDGAAAAIGDPELGQVRYTFVAADTEVPGDLIEQWKVTFGGGAVERFPSRKHKLRVHANA